MLQEAGLWRYAATLAAGSLAPAARAAVLDRWAAQAHQVSCRKWQQAWQQRAAGMAATANGSCYDAQSRRASEPCVSGVGRRLRLAGGRPACDGWGFPWHCGAFDGSPSAGRSCSFPRGPARCRPGRSAAVGQCPYVCFKTCIIPPHLRNVRPDRHVVQAKRPQRAMQSRLRPVSGNTPSSCCRQCSRFRAY